MNYHIEKKLGLADMDFLRSMIGEELKTVLIRPLYDEPISEGMECLGVDLITNVKRVKIVNDVIDEKDRDEWFQLEANDKEWGKWAPELQNLDLNFSGTITGVTVWRDCVSWGNEKNHWVVEADVAILLHFKDSQILFKAIDSLAGFIAIYNDEEAIRHEIEDAESTWLRFKTDKVDQCYRECLNLK